MDGVCKIDDFVNVSLRIKPPLSRNCSESSCLQVISKQPAILLVLDRSQTYHFDNIFTEETDQETVYNEAVKPLVEYVKQGYSCTVFAYGQTGTGKSYTMGTSQVGNNGEAGLIPRALDEFFTHHNDDIDVNISVSFMEIYNEKVFDLLRNNKLPLPVKGFQVQGFMQERVYNYREARHFLEMGNKNRHTSETRQNSNSSRSHAVFTIHCNIRHRDHETTAKLNLVDLAGCESVKKTGNQGSTFQEGVNINKGLLCIGQVMTALSTNSSFVPYRQSIITTILQDSLNRTNFVSLIACVNGGSDDCNETLQTLEFAQRAKRIKNRPEVTEVVTQYKKDHPTLFQGARTCCTPFKKPIALFQTPYVPKQVKMTPFEEVRESTDSLKSLASISVSSIGSTVDMTQQTLSPVIRKYMTAMESSLVDRIESIIRNTLERRKSTRRKRETIDKENNSGTPWVRIQNEVSKLVRNEIAQLTVGTIRATSSPIGERSDFDRIRKVLDYESPASDTNQESVKTKDCSDTETVFKMPDLPVEGRKLKRNKRSLSISSVEVIPRRSTRLSMKKTYNNDLDLTFDSNNFHDKSVEYTERRQSVRLAEKSHNVQSILEISGSASNTISLEESEHRLPNKSTRQSSFKLNNRTVKKLTLKATPAVKRLMKCDSRVDSPNTAHSRHVLKLLKDGNQKQLETLHLIGPKTAQQIILFRNLKGTVNRISDLASMPGWSEKKFKAFLDRNFIKDECL